LDGSWGSEVAAHQVQVRLGAASRRPRQIGGAVARAAAGGAGWAGLGAGLVLATCRPAQSWEMTATGILAAVLASAVISGRSAARASNALRRIAEAAGRALAGESAPPLGDLPGGDIGQVAAAFSQLLTDVKAERTELRSRLRDLDDEVRDLKAEAAQREAELDFQLKVASRYLREPALKVHAFANLLARDSGSRIDPRGREHLEDLCANAEALDVRLRELLDGCRIQRTHARDRGTAESRGVVSGGNDRDVAEAI